MPILQGRWWMQRYGIVQQNNLWNICPAWKEILTVTSFKYFLAVSVSACYISHCSIVLHCYDLWCHSMHICSTNFNFTQLNISRCCGSSDKWVTLLPLGVRKAIFFMLWPMLWNVCGYFIVEFVQHNNISRPRGSTSLGTPHFIQNTSPLVILCCEALAWSFRLILMSAPCL